MGAPLTSEWRKNVFDFLVSLGFSKAICAATIGLTIDVMHTEIENDCDLGVRVLNELHTYHAPHTVDKDNYETKLQDWIEAHATALHQEQAKAMLTPFSMIANLF